MVSTSSFYLLISLSVIQNARDVFTQHQKTKNCRQKIVLSIIQYFSESYSNSKKKEFVVHTIHFTWVTWLTHKSSELNVFSTKTMANNFDILPGYDHVVVIATLWERLSALTSCYQTLKYSFMGESNPRQLPILDSESVVYQSLIINPWPLCHSNLRVLALQRLVATKLSNTRLWTLEVEWCPLYLEHHPYFTNPSGKGSDYVNIIET